VAESTKFALCVLTLGALGTPFYSWLGVSCVLAWLLLTAWITYHRARRDESRATPGISAAAIAAIGRGYADDHQCEVCKHVVPRRYVVELFDDATLACAACAEILRGAPCA